MRSRRTFQALLIVNLVVLVGLTSFWLTTEASAATRVAAAVFLVFLAGVNLALLEYTRK